jgi:prephenate dehydratase
VFIIDLDGHQSEPRVQRALEEATRNANFCRVFGSFPRATAPARAASGEA